MSHEWLTQFVNIASHDPRSLVRTIGSARPEELNAAAEVVKLVPDPAAQILGYTALAGCSRALRSDFVTRAATCVDFLPSRDSQLGVLTELIDVLPEDTLPYFRAKLREIVEALPSREQRRYEKLLRGLRPMKHVAFDAGAIAPHQRLSIGLHDITSRVAKAHQRSTHIATQYQKGLLSSSPRVDREWKLRFNNIAKSVGFGPETFASSPAPKSFIEPVAAPQTAVPERVVSTGFTGEDGQPTRIVVKPDERYYYFIEIGQRVEGAAESGEVLPEDLAAGSIIEVVMFTNNDGMTIEGPHSGSFQIEDSGVVKVSKRASKLNVDDELLQRRMFFAFLAPQSARRCSLRCSFYCRGVLLQSRKISVPVGLRKPATVHPDYVLSRTLSPSYNAQLQPLLLSIMLNENDDGTHSLRFYGKEGEFERSSTFGELELRDHIMRARKGFRYAAWGTEDEWTPANPYLFSIPRTVDTFLIDIIGLARRGRVLWDAVIDKLAGGPDESLRLLEMMRCTGRVQLVLKEAANTVLPIALFYDHAWDNSRKDEEIQLCPAFVRSLGAELIEGPCLNGDCPNREDDSIVCPGGFWGFRHAISLPVSLGAQQSSPPEVPLFITSTKPSFVIGVSTDPMMENGKRIHLANLELKIGIPQSVSSTRTDVLRSLSSTDAPIVYFYCHGGLDKIEGPFLEVGPPSGPRIARNNLRKIRWRHVRPVVFINGCYTTRVSPDEALELVSAFVTTCGASGVVGTEITIFESLARAFGEAFFEEFVTNSRPAGEAIRRARLRLLKDSLNPLGLVYIPFVRGDLHLVNSDN